MGEPTGGIGRRLREIRAWRGLSLRVVAELAGLSAGHLSRIERGERALDSRRALYSLADALRVAPSELTGQPYPPSDAAESAAHAATQRLRTVLCDAELGEPAGTGTLAIGELADAAHRADLAAAASDYEALGELVPELLGELYTPARVDRQQRAHLLVRVLHDAFYLAKDLGHGDLAWAVSGHLERAAEKLGDPAWGAVASFVRAHAVVGEGRRERALTLSRRSAEGLAPDDGPHGEVYGMLHLSAGVQAASLGRPDSARDHLAEAEQVASRTGNGHFAGLMFGPTNVGVWRLAVDLELGEAGRAIEAARAVEVATLPSAGRQATFYCDLGQALARARGHEREAVEAIRRAERLAPGRVHSMPTARATVTVLLSRTRRDAGGRELRGLAHRMGLSA